MQCPQCHQPVDATHRFCATCGAPVVVPKKRRRIPWQPVIIGAAVLLLLGAAGFLYFLQVDRDLVIWVEQMKPDEANAVTVANKFLGSLNAGQFEQACTMNENSREFCLGDEVPMYKRVTEGGAKLQAIYAKQSYDRNGYMVYKVVVKQTRGQAETAYFLLLAPDSPKAPVISGPLPGTSWDKQILRRLSK